MTTKKPKAFVYQDNAGGNFSATIQSFGGSKPAYNECVTKRYVHETLYLFAIIAHHLLPTTSIPYTRHNSSLLLDCAHSIVFNILFLYTGRTTVAGFYSQTNPYFYLIFFHRSSSECQILF